MNEEKQFYLDCLKDGKMKHDTIFGRMKLKFAISATDVRNVLLSEGLIQEVGFVRRGDGKKAHLYELTKKKPAPKKEKVDSFRWEDGTMKSRGNAFNWRTFSHGLYSSSEIAATENGRKFGIQSASRKILPRVVI